MLPVNVDAGTVARTGRTIRGGPSFLSKTSGTVEGGSDPEDTMQARYRGPERAYYYCRPHGPHYYQSVTFPSTSKRVLLVLWHGNSVPYI